MELQNSSRSAHAPRERAHHQAAILGDYLVVHGGNIHLHQDEERCFDEKLYLYHLLCHVWVDSAGMALAHSRHGGGGAGGICTVVFLGGLKSSYLRCIVCAVVTGRRILIAIER